MAARLHATLAETPRARALRHFDLETEALYERAVAELYPGPLPEMPKSKRRRDVAARTNGEISCVCKEKPAAGWTPPSRRNPLLTAMNKVATN